MRSSYGCELCGGEIRDDDGLYDGEMVNGDGVWYGGALVMHGGGVLYDGALVTYDGVWYGGALELRGAWLYDDDGVWYDGALELLYGVWYDDALAQLCGAL